MKKFMNVTSVSEADWICECLKTRGIFSFAHGLHTVAAVPWLSGAIDGIDIFVHENHYETAKMIIANIKEEQTLRQEYQKKQLRKKKQARKKKKGAK